MPKVQLLFQSVGFNAETTARLGAGFDTAWQILKTADPSLSNSPRLPEMRERLAHIIIELGQAGVTDPARLAELAVSRLRL